jgi:branched-chain amino acid aminotransferase
LRVYDGVLFALDRHWRRMQRDSARLHVPLPADPAGIERALYRLIEANRAYNSTVRVCIVRNKGGMWEGPGIHRDHDVIAFTSDVNDWGESARLDLVANARHAASPFAGAKVTSWIQNLTWYEEAHEKGFDEVVLLNERGEVSECTSANIFAVFGKRAVTPPIASGCLPGITREILLEACSTADLAVVEEVLRPADLERADEVFITSTTRELMAVIGIEGLKIRNEDNGRKALQQRFTAFVHSYVAGHPRHVAPAARS